MPHGNNHVLSVWLTLDRGVRIGAAPIFRRVRMGLFVRTVRLCLDGEPDPLHLEMF
jgi:hypothetical protein